MLSASLGLLLLTLSPQTGFEGQMVYPGDPSKPTTRIGYLIRTNRLDPPKASPKKFGTPGQPFEFEWLV
ncbi:MAG TPA: hypothetical protein VEX38_02365, partial [Fimbriimonadaceae bacterium]|nr:hypothetical protein [Fimbriimonadaceae bacterium]